jgi:hypothetical protein
MAATRPGGTRAAAKRRRQAIILVVLAAVVAAVLAYEARLLLNRSAASTSSSASSLSAVAALNRAAKSAHGRAGGDPFQGNPLPNQDAKAVKVGGPDPFKGGPRAVAAQKPIPGQIVIGRPGGNRVATHGWIVILASIPSRNGRASAAHFARGARPHVGSLSILNSSRRRPLRGGYWVVYGGPYRSLGAVSRRAAYVHAAGYRTAYIRELITYR